MVQLMIEIGRRAKMVRQTASGRRREWSGDVRLAITLEG